MPNRRSIMHLCLLCCLIMLPTTVRGHHPDMAQSNGTAPNQEQAKQLVEQGRQYISQRAYRDAATAFQKATQLDPQHADAYFSWGIALGALEQRHAEIEKYEQAVHYNPKLAEAYVAWGLALWQLGRPADARAKLLEALAVDPYIISPAQKVLLKALGLSE
ncbi:MAG: tetratricopeptide repeat protein [Nitrospinae bacterium]|nr:tetratricopeptide repeat protein [Nitrospinota bacterium]